MTALRDREMAHEYDGIREFDNPTPGWWHGIFFLTMLFSIIYFAFWEISTESWSIHDAWEAHQVAEYRRIFGAMGELAPDEPTILRMSANPQMLAVAEGIFRTNCAACHARDGGAKGLTGVNLTDDSYKNVKRVGDLITVINKGANNGAMPAWQNRLSGNQRVILAGYVASLRGKNTPGKPPEGEAIPAWPPVPQEEPKAAGAERK
jgi:cytochrome c oxidase cbb3-type subunit 3